MRHLSRRRAGALATLVTSVALVAGLMLVSTSPAQAADRTIALILDYRVVSTCPVYTNYPKEGVSRRDAWWITPSDIVGWRYNVNGDWAMISDKKYRKTSHAWWGFTPRVCIGGSVGGEPFPTPDSSYPAWRGAARSRPTTTGPSTSGRHRLT